MEDARRGADHHHRPLACERTVVVADTVRVSAWRGAARVSELQSDRWASCSCVWERTGAELLASGRGPCTRWRRRRGEGGEGDWRSGTATTARRRGVSLSTT
ncbi:hypothetical protein STCU_11184 [Strigomonas culicis]|uniref:Uncharacterized protein n=1 Tax=Strigomonas culicis TaxID=28005 RepID=S9UPB3_9TRYP|nr:hypothetical protein STCU_11184 [Strigomonas culicis]|eukprot:EPY16511.1 hypothetical protein STCU_11184 [Strigomonas culicis]